MNGFQMSSGFEWKTPSRIVDGLLGKVRLSPKDRIETAWKGIGIPPSKARIITLKGSTLIIGVAGSAAMQEFWFRKEELLEKLNRRLGGSIKDIKFRLGGYS